MAYDVTVIPGDGVGPEVSEATRWVLEATGVVFIWDIQSAGEEVFKIEGELLPDRVLDSIRRNKVSIKGPLTTPIGSEFRSVNVGLRKSLDLYANLRPAKSYPGVRSRYTNVNIIVVRENTEDVCAGVEFEKDTPETLHFIKEAERYLGISIPRDSAVAMNLISVTGTERIVRFAFDYARANGRGKVDSLVKTPTQVEAARAEWSNVGTQEMAD
ncbi:MAG: isocitrate/isopropylmalate family dehydrogenase, partial [Chloroflexi bacterium]|nr:isocitrate/isopropylmalate family dehydrogenase [Chloroflexota bacterium]